MLGKSAVQKSSHIKDTQYFEFSIHETGFKPELEKPASVHKSSQRYYKRKLRPNSVNLPNFMVQHRQFVTK